MQILVLSYAFLLMFMVSALPQANNSYTGYNLSANGASNGIPEDDAASKNRSYTNLESWEELILSGVRFIQKTDPNSKKIYAIEAIKGAHQGLTPGDFYEIRELATADGYSALETQNFQPAFDDWAKPQPVYDPGFTELAYPIDFKILTLAEALEKAIHGTDLWGPFESFRLSQIYDRYHYWSEVVYFFVSEGKNYVVKVGAESGTVNRYNYPVEDGSGGSSIGLSSALGLSGVTTLGEYPPDLQTFAGSQSAVSSYAESSPETSPTGFSSFLSGTPSSGIPTSETSLLAVPSEAIYPVAVPTQPASPAEVSVSQPGVGISIHNSTAGPSLGQISVMGAPLGFRRTSAASPTSTSTRDCGVIKERNRGVIYEDFCSF